MLVTVVLDVSKPRSTCKGQSHPASEPGFCAEDSLRYQRELLAFEKLNPGYTAEMVSTEALKSARLAVRQQAQQKREELAPLAAIAKPKSAWQLFLVGCTAGTGASFTSLNRDQKVQSFPGC